MADSIDQITKKHALSGWPMILAWVAMIIFACHASTHMVGAGDTWVAMACGRHFINHGVDTIEPFSANSHKAGPTEETMVQYAKDLRAGLYSVKDPPSGMKKSVMSWWLKKVENYPNWSDGTKKLAKYWHPTGWINQNWLTHVLFYWLTHLSPFADAEELSYNSLVYWKIALYILNVICVYYIGRLFGINPALSAFFACFAMFVGRSFFDVRPAGFSNLLVAVYLLILVLTTHRNILYIWLLVPVVALWCNLHGGYIYAFIMLIPFIGLHLLMALPKKWSLILYNVTAWPLFLMVAISMGSKKLPQDKAGSAYLLVFLFFVGIIVLDIVLVTLRDRLLNIGYKGLIHTVAASFAAFIAMIVLNPFHFTNITHTFVISVSKQAERWRTVNEWHPAFEWNNPVGDEIPFLIMYIIAWILLAVWAVIFLKTRITLANLPKRRQKDKDKEKETYKLPKIDITFIAIAALTIYMAIRSRRFIPIAAMAACPVLALFIEQIARAISATANFRKTNSLTVPAMSHEIQNYFTVAGAVAVLFFGTWWGLKFKTVYLDVWPTDPNLTSVFMRMTASDVKPFYALRFINENKLEGKMFNYWTEGGFIAYGQDPDPNTGKTSLQLFMDGRAQAAYLQTTYDLWSNIMSGGPVAYRLRREARTRGKKLSASDYRQIGAWIDKQLTKYQVWAVLMPAGRFSGHFVRGLEYDPNWNVIFYNNKQKLLVRWSDDHAQKLFKGIDTGQTKYPDEFSRNLIRSHYRLQPGKNSETLQQGLQFAIDAFNNHPSNAPMQKILYATRLKNQQIAAKATQFCQEYFDRFVENEEQWKYIDGYHHRLAAALNASGHLRNLAVAQKDQEKIKSYDSWRQEHTFIIKNIVKTKRW